MYYQERKTDPMLAISGKEVQYLQEAIKYERFTAKFYTLPASYKLTNPNKPRSRIELSVSGMDPSLISIPVTARHQNGRGNSREEWHAAYHGIYYTSTQLDPAMVAFATMVKRLRKGDFLELVWHSYTTPVLESIVVPASQRSPDTLYTGLTMDHLYIYQWVQRKGSKAPKLKGSYHIFSSCNPDNDVRMVQSFKTGTSSAVTHPPEEGEPVTSYDV